MKKSRWMYITWNRQNVKDEWRNNKPRIKPTPNNMKKWNKTNRSMDLEIKKNNITSLFM